MNKLPVLVLILGITLSGIILAKAQTEESQVEVLGPIESSTTPVYKTDADLFLEATEKLIDVQDTNLNLQNTIQRYAKLYDQCRSGK